MTGESKLLHCTDLALILYCIAILRVKRTLIFNSLISSGRPLDLSAAESLQYDYVVAIFQLAVVPFRAWHHLVAYSQCHALLRQILFLSEVSHGQCLCLNLFVVDFYFHRCCIKGVRGERGGF